MGKVIVRLSDSAETELRVLSAELKEPLGYVVTLGLQALKPDRIKKEDLEEAQRKKGEKS